MIKVDREKIIRDFVDLTSIDSVSFEERTMADVLIARLTALGFEVAEDDAGEKIGGNAGNIYAHLPGNLDETGMCGDREGIILAAHMDTVVPGRGKRAVVHEDGLITSDGETVLGADDVSGIVSILDGVEAVIKAGVPRRDIEVIFTAAEEVYVRGATVFDCTRFRSRDVYVFDMSGEVGTAAVKAPAIIKFEATVHGHPAHAGFSPELGRHAVKAAADCISKLRMGRTSCGNTFNVGLIHADGATNIVPSECVFSGEARGYDVKKAYDDIRNMRKTLAESIELMTGEHVEFDGDVALENDDSGKNSIDSSEETDESTLAANAQGRCHGDDTVTIYESINDNGIGYTVRVELMQREVETDREDPCVCRFKKACEELDIGCKIINTFGGSDLNVFGNRGLTGIVLASGMNDVHSTAEWTHVDELVRSTELCAVLVQPR